MRSQTEFGKREGGNFGDQGQGGDWTCGLADGMV